MKVKMNVYGIFLGKPKGKWRLGIIRRKWENNIKTYLREMRSGGMDGIVLT
jgi:hypothetical protein